jgi:hypothetical protein
MENLPARVLHDLYYDLVPAFIPPDTPAGAILELVVTVEGENIPAREFASYLALMDRLYGRLSKEGLRSYAHREWGRFQIAEIHKSELEIIFRTLQGYHDTATYIAIGLFLKGLPNMLKRATEGYKSWADARKSLADARKSDEEAAAIREDTRHKEIVNRNEEERLAQENENRKRIEETIKQEDALQKLEDEQISRLIGVLDDLLIEENENLAAPIRFARHQVKGVQIRVGRVEIEDQSDVMDEPKDL